jgi:hypothetical protein
MSSGPPCQAAWQSDGIFVGTVQSITSFIDKYQIGTSEHSRQRRRVRVKVLESFRGSTESEIDVYTGSGGGDCGYGFETQRSYLIYAYREPVSGQWGTGICSRTMPIDSAKGDLEYLRGPFRSGAVLGVIQGQVSRQDPATEGQPPQVRPYPNAQLLIESIETNSARSYKASADARGRFTVQVAVGKYRVTPVLPPELYSYSSQVEVMDVRGCAQTDFRVLSNGRIAGRVVDPDGRPIPDLSIEIIDAGSVTREYFSSRDRARSDQSGEFEFSRLPPGTYRLGLDLQQEPRKINERILWFRDGEDVRPFETLLGLEQRIWTRTFVVSEPLARVEGIVVDQSGKPLADASVYLNFVPRRQSAATKADAQGRFAFTTRMGIEYQLIAEYYPAAGGFKNVQSEPFRSSSSLPPITLRIQR